MYSVGIVTRTKNRAVLLRRALESITRQTYQNWQLVVVNDGGGAVAVDALLAQYQSLGADKIRVIHNPTSVGMEAASNLGLALLGTDYAVIHDDDDSWSPDFLARMMEVLAVEKARLPSLQGIVCYSNRVLETVVGNLVTVDYTEPFNHWIQPGLISLERMLFENMFPPISFIFSLQVCKELEGFSEDLPVLGDWDFHIRFLLKHDIWMLPEAMAFYHHRPSADGAMGNSVISGLDKHRLYRSVLMNRWIREDLAGRGSGLGLFCAGREHIEFFHRDLSQINGRLLAVEERLAGVALALWPLSKLAGIVKRSRLWSWAKRLRAGLRGE